jgi:hypothetical protein
LTGIKQRIAEARESLLGETTQMTGVNWRSMKTMLMPCAHAL